MAMENDAILDNVHEVLMPGSEELVEYNVKDTNHNSDGFSSGRESLDSQRNPPARGPTSLLGRLSVVVCRPLPVSLLYVRHQMNTILL